MLCLCSTAKEVEAIVRKEGATPATVGVIEGEVRVGLTSEELDHLAGCGGSVKVSRRDLPYVLSKVRFTLGSASVASRQPWPPDAVLSSRSASPGARRCPPP